jgi:hypothetical protein
MPLMPFKLPPRLAAPARTLVCLMLSPHVLRIVVAAPQQTYCAAGHNMGYGKDPVGSLRQLVASNVAKRMLVSPRTTFTRHASV